MLKLLIDYNLIRCDGCVDNILVVIVCGYIYMCMYGCLYVVDNSNLIVINSFGMY